MDKDDPAKRDPNISHIIRPLAGACEFGAQIGIKYTFFNYQIVIYSSGPQLFCRRGPVNVRLYYCGPETGRIKFVRPDKLDGVYVFTVMLSSVTVIGIALRNDFSCAVRYQLFYGPAPVCSTGGWGHWFRGKYE